MKATFILVGVLLVAAAAWFMLSPRSTSNLLIEQAVARQTENGDIGVYLTINNQGIPDRLISVDSALGEVSLFNPSVSGDLPIQLGRSSLATDAAHILIAATDAPYETGTLLPLTLSFENAGDIQVKALMSDGQDQGHAGMAHMAAVDQGAPFPTVDVAATAEGDGWNVTITTQRFTFSEDQMGTAHHAGVGHAHIYVGGIKLGRVFGGDYRIGKLPTGTHQIQVTLNTNDHRAHMGPTGPVTAVAVIVVD